MTTPTPTSPAASRLAPCGWKPNCVSTLAPAGPKSMDPIPYDGPLTEARRRMLKVLRDYPRTRILQEEPDYLKAECRSRVFRFVDDVEIAFDDAAKLIHFRSAARLGVRDFGVNRKRMEEIRELFLGGS